VKQFISDHFAVLVVLLVFFALFFAYMAEIHLGHNPGSLDWLEGEMKEVIGAILMGLTGAARTLVNGQGQRSSDAKLPEPPKP
jgi:protein-S-isoprenylcysteine O-methyltransferase Ste14